MSQNKVGERTLISMASLLLSAAEQRALLAATWPSDATSRHKAQAIWYAQDLKLAPLPPRATAQGETLLPLFVFPQRFNGPCGLLAALQAELVVQAAARGGGGAPASAAAALEAAVHAMLLRAAGGRAEAVRVAVAHQCPCGHALPEPPAADLQPAGGPSGAAAAPAAPALCSSCQCPADARLPWVPAPLWRSAACQACGARTCLDCAAVAVRSGAAGVAGAAPLLAARGGALLLLHSLALSAGEAALAALAKTPLVGLEASRDMDAVYCAKAMVTLAAWGALGAKGSEAHYFAAAAAAAAVHMPEVGVLEGSEHSNFNIFAGPSAPSVWLALAGGHWRVICTDARVLRSSGAETLAVLQLDGLPRAKAGGTSVESSLVLAQTPGGVRQPHPADAAAAEEGGAAAAAAATAAAAAAAAAPPPPAEAATAAAAAAEPPRLDLLGYKAEEGRFHVVWEAGHCLEAASATLPARGPQDRWYCRTCYFDKSRDSFEGVFQPAEAAACQRCQLPEAQCGASRWVPEGALAALAPQRMQAYHADPAHMDKLSLCIILALRGRWCGARVPRGARDAHLLSVE